MSFPKRLCIVRWMLLSLLPATVPGYAQDSDNIANRTISQHKQLDNIDLTLHIDRQAMSIADYLTYRLSVELPADLAVTFETVDDYLGPFRIASRHPLGPLKTTDQREQWVREYVLEAEQTGELTIPSLQVEIGIRTMGAKTGCVLFLDCDRTTPAAPKTSDRQLSTDPVIISVSSVVPEDASITEIKDIAAPAVLPKPPDSVRPLLLWAAGAGSAGVLLLAGWLLWQRRHTPAVVFENTILPPHQRALQALHDLEQSDLLAGQQIEAFYMQLTAILRQYIAGRFTLQASNLTSDELLRAMAARNEPDAALRHQLGAFLRHCDLVKFARHPAAAGDMRQVLQQARAFIERTAPAPASEQPAQQEAS